MRLLSTGNLAWMGAATRVAKLARSVLAHFMRIWTRKSASGTGAVEDLSTITRRTGPNARLELPLGCRGGPKGCFGASARRQASWSPRPDAKACCEDPPRRPAAETCCEDPLRRPLRCRDGAVRSPAGTAEPAASRAFGMPLALMSRRLPLGNGVTVAQQTLTLFV